jgi:colicin import membrane protein
MNQDAARAEHQAARAGRPLDLAQARNAVELARLAGANQFAADSFNKAAALLATAEEARTARRGGNAIMMPARQAAQTAEDARLVGLQRQEEAYQVAERAAALARENTARDRAQAEAEQRRRAELATQTPPRDVRAPSVTRRRLRPDDLRRSAPGQPTPRRRERRRSGASDGGAHEGSRCRRGARAGGGGASGGRAREGS